ncbi:MAG: hypothetical protein HYX68_08060 [Planctomycetes bacterium]|nr:hypothetical protein [Planctomycetota bacterium]
MRLTLRTLLSYLDDTLEPSQAKQIGAKVAESEQARELMERIKQVTRRRRLTTPPTTGPGGMDANTIAEYLDNEVTPEKSAEVEQICLASDVHLAEVAACHQILTLVLGEPALVPPSAKQRMYGLVKGPEAIPFRKPARASSKDDNDLSSEIEPNHDETLRLGVPAVGVGGLNRNVLLIAGGGVLAACLLVFAVWQIMKKPDDRIIEPKGDDRIVQADSKKKEPDQKKPPENKADDKKKKKPDEPKNKDSKKEITPAKKDGIVIEDVKIKPAPGIPYFPANNKIDPIGKYLDLGIKAPAVLLTKPDKGGWKRITKDESDVVSGQPLVSLPGSKSVVTLASGIEVILWGNLPEITQDIATLESRITLHATGQLDGDLTLDRGRILLRNKKATGQDAFVRVRFANPTLGQEEYFDFTLQGIDAAVIVERFGTLNQDDPFVEDPKDKKRTWPTAHLRVFAYGPSVRVRSGGDNYQLDAENLPMMQWESRTALLARPDRVMLPPWFKGTSPPKKEAEKLMRKKAEEAHQQLAKLLDAKGIDVALAELEENVQKNVPNEILMNKKISEGTLALWRHALRCSMAVDDVAHVWEEFAKPKQPIFVRGVCMQAIQQWLALNRDNDYVLLKILRKNFRLRETESIKIMERFHYISVQAASKPVTYQYLIEDLNNDLLPIRTLSHWHLLVLAPVGASIPYDPDMPAPLRMEAVQRWSTLIRPGQLPPRMAPPKTKGQK